MARRRHQEGSLRIRGKRRKVWIARWREDMLKPDGTLGRVRRAEVLGPGGQLSKRDALNLLETKLKPINQGRYVPQSVLTLSEFIQRVWEPTIVPLLKPTSARYYGIQLRCHITPHLGKHRLCDLTRGEVQAFLAKKRAEGLSGSSVHGIRTALSKLLQSAVEWNFLPANPARGLVGDRHPRKSGHSLSQHKSANLFQPFPSRAGRSSWSLH